MTFLATNSAPIQAPSFLRISEVRRRTGLGRSTIYRRIDEGRFPKPVKLGARTNVWAEHEISKWVLDQLAKLQ